MLERLRRFAVGLLMPLTLVNVSAATLPVEIGFEEFPDDTHMGEGL